MSFRNYLEIYFVYKLHSEVEYAGSESELSKEDIDISILESRKKTDSRHHLRDDTGPEWVNKPFFVKFDPNAIWLNDLKPALGSKWPHTEITEENVYEFPLLEKEIEVTVN